MTSERGQSMFELVVAIAVISITLVALFSLATRSVGNTTKSHSANEANRLSQEVIEWLRGERDANWDSFAGRAGAWCFRSLKWNLNRACGPNEVVGSTIFVRDAALNRVDVNTVEAVVVTKWTDQNGENQARVTAQYTNWRTN